MDGCVLISANYISNPNVYVGRNQSKYSNFTKFKKFIFVALVKMYLRPENGCVVNSLIDIKVHIIKWEIKHFIGFVFICNFEKKIFLL